MNSNISHLEAQAFNYLSFGFITLLNNFWTWLAFNFWRTLTPKPELLPPPNQDPVQESGPGPAPPCVPSPTLLRNGPNAAADVHGLRKGKFTVYYEDDEIQRECERDVTETETVTEEDTDGNGSGRQEWWESWERLLRMKQGVNDKGWYTCQDLTAFNGSVVRLWGDAAFTTEYSRSCRSCVLVW